MNTAGWVLVVAGLVLIMAGAVVEVRRRPAVMEEASKNPLVEIIKAVGALFKELTGLFKVLKDYTTGRFLMAMGLILVILGVIVGLV